MNSKKLARIEEELFSLSNMVSGGSLGGDKLMAAQLNALGHDIAKIRKRLANSLEALKDKL